MSLPTPDGKQLPGPWPWYAILFTGVGLSGFFVWFMVCWALWARDKKGLCLAGLAANFAVFGAMRLASVHVSCECWILSLGTMFLDLAWTMGAWYFQYSNLGPAPARYRSTKPGQWVAPVLVGGLLGFCIAALISIPQAMESRIEMLSLWDSLNREIVLWDFFKDTFSGIAAGIFVGAWWAGNPKGFRVRDVVCYLAGTMIAGIGLLLLFKLQAFLIAGGGEALNLDNRFNAVAPSWGDGVGDFVLTLGNYSESLGLIVLPLLFGAPTRFRDFARRTLLIPLAFFCSFPFWMTSNSHWMDYQGKVVYRLSSPDDSERHQAQKELEVLLARYPGHARWPSLAEKHASYLYHEGRTAEAMEYNRRIVEGYSGLNQWFWTVSQAKAILEDSDASRRNPMEWLDVPIIEHESYLTGNWMCLLSVIKYWEGEDVPESQIKARLRAMSETQDVISLRPMLSFAHLDDAASNMGYKTFILPSDIETAQRLMEKGIPVFLEGYQQFYLMVGFDKGRSLSLTYNFFPISNRLLKDNRAEAEEVLGLEDEGKSRQRRERIRREAYWEMSPNVWEDPAKRVISPFMAVVAPESYLSIVAEAVGQPPEDLERLSKARLAALIGLTYVQAGNPVQAVEWARVSARGTDEPLPLYVAHLAHTLWKNRRENVKSQIGLEGRFEELQEIIDYFKQPAVLDFLEKAEQRFEADLDNPGLPRMIYRDYLPFLHKSDPAQRLIIEKIYNYLVQADPSRSRDWSRLADIYEFANDIPPMVLALEGQISASPVDQKARLRAAYGYVLLDQAEKAKEVLEEADTRRLRHEADHQFVLGAIAEWEEKPEKALSHYSTAVDMRRHIPVYHLHYGRALLAMGRTADAKMALEWACRIDPGTVVTEKAKKILASMEKNT
ncbi:MAG: tetratricopeptide repeat protein [Desulfatibacillum sp.]|nr:tetratricopeptide repeat protein [Desulfatibacillum sp.]